MRIRDGGGKSAPPRVNLEPKTPVGIGLNTHQNQTNAINAIMHALVQTV